MNFKVSFWLPQIDWHGADFTNICDKCQAKILEEIKEGVSLPNNLRLDTSVGLGLHGLSFNRLDLCETCAKNFAAWLWSKRFIQISGEPIELWLRQKEE